MFFIPLYLSLLLMPGYSGATEIGSDTSVARQSRAFFKKNESESNKMKGFSVFKKGMVFEDPSTSVLFDAFFPVSGDVVLNGGTLDLKGDLEFKNPFRIGVGTVLGNEFSLQFPRNISYLDFPSLYYIKLIMTLMDQADAGNDVYSLDWSYDDAYLVVGLQGSGGNSELKIFSFDGVSLTEVASQDFGTNNLNSVKWSLSSDYIVTGASGGVELKSWLFTRGINSLQEVDSVNFGAVSAVAWNPDGDHVAVGGKGNSSFYVYPVLNGLFGTELSISLGGNETVRNNAIDWNGAGDHIAVGLKESLQSELRIFNFNGSQLIAAGELNFGENVEGVAWRTNTSAQLVVGLGGGSERLRIYTYDAVADSLTELSSARVDLDPTVYSVAWDSVGRYLAVTKEYASKGYEMEVYYFDDINNTLHLVSGYNPDSTSRTVSWAHSGDYLVNGDDAGECYLYNFTGKPFVFKDLKIYFGSEVRMHASIHFQGDCVMNGSGNILQLSPTTSLVIEPGATLQLEDMTIKGISGGNIYCLGDDSVLHLRDANWMQDSDTTFTMGAIRFNNRVTMKGDSTFSYQSLQTSTVVTRSELLFNPLFTFAYEPLGGADNTLLEFEDSSSQLVLNGAIITTNEAGLHLKKGKLLVERDSFFFTDSANGITIGNSDVSQDFPCDILSGSVLHLSQGSLNYKNVRADSWQMISERSWLKMMNNTTLRLFENIDLGLGVLWFAGKATLARKPGKKSIGRIHVQGGMHVEGL